MKPKEQTELMISALRRYADSIEVAAIRHIDRPNEEAPVAHPLPDDTARLEKVLGWLKFENAKNEANIWIRPDPATSHPWLLIDDLAGKVARTIAMKYASIVVETSAGNCQCRLLSSQSLDERSRGQVQSMLVHLLNQNAESADPRSTAGDKWGRLAGFRNQKPGRNYWTNLVLDTTASSTKFDPAPYLSPVGGGACVSPVVDTHRVSMSLFPGRGLCPSDSEREYGWVLNRLRFFQAKGFDVVAEAEVLKLKLIENAAHRGKRNPQDYARRTIVAALRKLG